MSELKGSVESFSGLKISYVHAAQTFLDHVVDKRIFPPFQQEILNDPALQVVRMVHVLDAVGDFVCYERLSL